MEMAMGMALWPIGKLVDLLSAELLTALDESSSFGQNARDIKEELLYTQGLLHRAQELNVAHSPPLVELLRQLSHLAEDADNALDKVDYYRIRDAVKHTKEAAADEEVDGIVRRFTIHARHALSKCRPSSQTFNRSTESKKIKLLIAQIQPLCEKIHKLLNLESIPNPKHLTTAAASSEEIFNSIVTGEVSWRRSNIEEPHNLEQLHIQLERMLQSKRFLLVLDDMSCDSEYTWDMFLAPFRKTMVKGSTVIVTTRSEKIANMVKSGTDLLIHLDSLNPEAFWAFFLACAFGDERPEHHKELIDLGIEIVKKLNFSLLAAKTVGCLLKKDLNTQHWSRVLDSNVWEHGENSDPGIMPALQLTYNCLPFHLQKCFMLCALFPYDYHYNELELTHLWSALGIINCSNQDDRVQDIGLLRINELVNSGIFQKVDGVKISHQTGREVKYTYYVMHGLFHELAQIVSSCECLGIDCFNPLANTLTPSIRHLSIRTRCTSDIIGVDHYQNLKEELKNLKEQISIPNLHSLMFIGEFDECFSEAFKEILKEIKHVRVLRLFQTTLESLPHTLIHLRYLRIQASKRTTSMQLQSDRSMGETQTPATNDTLMSLPSSLPRYYHLRFLDLQDWMGMPEVPEGMHISHLIHLHQFLATKELQSSVAEVGKLKLLQELTMFQVKRGDRDGFELQQLGELTYLGGALTISNLHKVKKREAAEKAKLKLKKNLVRLKLVWDDVGSEQTEEEADSIEGLQPPANLRELCIKNHKGNTCPSWFDNTISLRRIEVFHLHAAADSDTARFPSADSCGDFSEGCPELSLPPMPYAPMLQLVEVATRQYMLLYNKYTLEIRGMDNLDKVLRFHDMEWLVHVTIKVCPSVPLGTLQKLTSLEALTLEDCSSLSSGRGENAVIKISIKHLVLRNCNITGKELSKILACCPYLSHLEIEDCNGITGLCMQQSVHEMDIDGSDVGVLQFASKFTSTLSRLGIFSRNHITLNMNGEVLQKLKSLQWLQLGGCVLSCAAMQAVDDDLPLANNLKVLRAYGCDMPNLEQDRLVTKMVRKMVAGSFQLEELDIGSISGILVAPICDHLSTSLHRLTFRNDTLVQSFTEDQETALRKLTSLHELVFYGCDRLQSLPSSLYTLPSLRRLEVSFWQLQGSPELLERCDVLRRRRPEVVLTCIPLI
uniref:Uncharacterized protein n=1 Tax=Oryza glumipatula TaxID=40148 RepID=A0A0E0B7F9_9ORYZ